MSRCELDQTWEDRRHQSGQGSSLEVFLLCGFMCLVITSEISLGSRKEEDPVNFHSTEEKTELVGGGVSHSLAYVKGFDYSIQGSVFSIQGSGFWLHRTGV